MADYFNTLDISNIASFTSTTVNGGDVSLPNTAGSWELLATSSIPETSVAARAGDVIEVTLHGLRTTDGYVDMAVVTGAGPTVARYLATMTSTAAVDGDAGWYPNAAYSQVNGPRRFTAEAGDIDGGLVRVRMACKAAGFGVVYASSVTPLTVSVARWPQ